MKERLPCEFFLIRYVPDVVKGEFTNIGVLLREAGRHDGAVVRFTRDWSRVHCMDADADIGLLEGLEAEIAARVRMEASDLKPVMAVLEDTLSNSLQITPARACLAESVPAELEQLMKMYVEPLKVKVERKRTGRAAIAGAMRTEFERAGVWGLMRKRIAASLYTRAGDPMKIDCGYRAARAQQQRVDYSDVSGGFAGGGCGGGEGAGLLGSAVDGRSGASGGGEAGDDGDRGADSCGVFGG